MRAHNDELVGASDDALDALFAESDDAVAAARAVLAAAVAPPPGRAASEEPETAVRRRLGGARRAPRGAPRRGGGGLRRVPGPLGHDRALLPCSQGEHAGLRRRDGRFRPGDSGAAACPTCPV